MTEKRRFPAYSHQREGVLVAGSFTTDGSGDVAAITEGAGLFTAARTGTGVYTVTLTEGYSGVVPIAAVEINAAAADNTFQFGAVTPATGVFTIVAKTAATAGNKADTEVAFAVYARKGAE